MAFLDSADANIRDGVVEDTHRKADRHWAQWLHFIALVGFHPDPFLDEFTPIERQRALCAFAQSVRDCTWSRSTKGYPQIKSESCQAAVQGVAQAFVASGRLNPTLDAQTGRRALLLHRLFRGMHNNDPGVRHQKCIPYALLTQLFHTPRTTAAGTLFNHLATLAYFFALRSCEYLKVTPDNSPRRTLPLRLSSFTFWKADRVIPIQSPDIWSADAVTLSFRFQKRDARDESVTQQRTANQPDCPVLSAAAIVTHLLHIREQHGSQLPLPSRRDPEVFWYIEQSSCRALTGSQCLKFLRTFMLSVDAASYGLHADDIGLHSLRSSSAMAMYLNGVPVYTIMLIGRWSSDAFLRYIRKQVKEFGHDVSNRMTQRASYHHVPDIACLHPHTRLDPLATAYHKMGNRGQPISRGVFSVWN